jgi:hypothetical protein
LMAPGVTLGWETAVVAVWNRSLARYKFAAGA